MKMGEKLDRGQIFKIMELKKLAWFDYVEYISLPLLIVIEVIALVLLYRHKDSKRNKHQVYIIAALCLTELNGTLSFIIYYIVEHGWSVSPVVIDIFHCYFVLFNRLTYYLVMTLVTIDRYLVFYWNIKYLIYWPPQRLLKSIISICLISFLIWFSFSCLVALKEIDGVYLVNIIFVPYFIWDVIYIGLFLATYIYIFILCKRHAKVFKERKFRPNHSAHFKLLLPTLFILTFILFVCIPDFFIIFVYYRLLNGKEMTVNYIAFTFYRIAWLVDPVIYIYNCKFTKKKKQQRRTEMNRF